MHMISMLNTTVRPMPVRHMPIRHIQFATRASSPYADSLAPLRALASLPNDGSYNDNGDDDDGLGSPAGLG